MARILHLIAANHRRGAETFAVQLGHHLQGRGHDVRVLAQRDAATSSPLDVELAGRSRWDPAGMARTMRAAAWADVVVAFGSTALLNGAAACGATRTPFVYRTIGDPTVWGRVRAANLRIGAPLRSAAAVVALYGAAADFLVERYRADPDRLCIIPRGVPVDRFAPSSPTRRAAARAELGLDHRLRWVAYVGSLSIEKDPLLAVAAIGAAGPEIGLVVAGDGPLADEVRRASAPWQDRIRLLGAVGDVRPVYAAADALVLPSRTEGIPGAAVEAGLCGLPVVGFPVGGVPEVVEQEVTGLLVETRDPSVLAAALAVAVERRDAWGAAGRQRCRDRFSMESVGAAWDDLVTEIAP
jgi:glycosyltransferase involved in cell wall biosynthesis